VPFTSTSYIAQSSKRLKAGGRSPDVWLRKIDGLDLTTVDRRYVFTEKGAPRGSPLLRFFEPCIWGKHASA
jgi:hypothetical protein